MTSDDYFKGKRVILFSLPGAFTPTCSTYQLPGFEENFAKFRENGIDGIYCMSWACWCAKTISASACARCYAAIINDGVVEAWFEEPGLEDNLGEDPYGESSPENLLKYLETAKPNPQPKSGQMTFGGPANWRPFSFTRCNPGTASLALVVIRRCIKAIRSTTLPDRADQPDASPPLPALQAGNNSAAPRRSALRPKPPTRPQPVPVQAPLRPFPRKRRHKLPDAAPLDSAATRLGPPHLRQLVVLTQTLPACTRSSDRNLCPSRSFRRAKMDNGLSEAIKPPLRRQTMRRQMALARFQEALPNTVCISANPARVPVPGFRRRHHLAQMTATLRRNHIAAHPAGFAHK
ncbi:hypothetical protein AAFF_G00191950 [Aldrovandia affinis]|uniref:thioredoxin-dependent peroxiredoxin n=1 Tax=Aldrovandia affinis TaxID=143900 RepID=A0AAD7R067_9TELE|nr:hypothetical protein AAFF_G00191950 [Aldrovandia affinis]